MHGLESDYASLHKEGKADRDRFELHWNQLLINSVGEAAAASVTLYFHTVTGRDLCRVHVPASAFPVNATIKLEKNGQMVKTTAFFVRIGNGTREIKNESEKQKYIAARWGN